MVNESSGNSLPGTAASVVDFKTQMRYFISMEYLNTISSVLYSDCAQVKSLLTGSVDGEYCLSLNGTVANGTRVYCHGLDIDTPREYITLPAGPDENFSFTNHHTKSSGRIQYKKLSLDLANMQISGWDDTFAIKTMTVDNRDPWINPYPVLGKAWSCPSFDKGSMSINLIGTGFYIPESVHWILEGSNPTINMEMRTEQKIRAECYGTCGGCMPSSDGTNTYRTTEGQTIAIRFDPELDTTACIPP